MYAAHEVAEPSGRLCSLQCAVALVLYLSLISSPNRSLLFPAITKTQRAYLPRHRRGRPQHQSKSSADRCSSCSQYCGRRRIRPRTHVPTSLFLSGKAEAILPDARAHRSPSTKPSQHEEDRTYRARTPERDVIPGRPLCAAGGMGRSTA